MDAGRVGLGDFRGNRISADVFTRHLGVRMDLVESEAVVSKFSLFFWPALFLLCAVVWAQTPSATVTQTANIPTATPQMHASNTVTPILVTPTMTPVEPHPVGAAPVFPNQSYSITQMPGAPADKQPQQHH